MAYAPPFTVTLHQEPFRHYKVNGSWNIGKRRIAGVTTVLGDQADFLSKWAAGQAYLAAAQFGAPREVADLAYERGLGPDAIRDAGGRRGDAAHLVFAALCRGDAPPLELVTELTWPYVKALTDCVSELSLHDGDSEVAVASWRHAYAGTYDRFEYGSDTLYDVKTGSPDWKHALQLGAYESARREMGMRHAKHLVLIYPTAYGTWFPIDVRQLGGYAAARRGFLQTLALYRQRSTTERLIMKARPR